MSQTGWKTPREAVPNRRAVPNKWETSRNGLTNRGHVSNRRASGAARRQFPVLVTVAPSGVPPDDTSNGAGESACPDALHPSPASPLRLALARTSSQSGLLPPAPAAVLSPARPPQPGLPSQRPQAWPACPNPACPSLGRPLGEPETQSPGIPAALGADRQQQCIAGCCTAVAGLGADAAVVVGGGMLLALGRAPPAGCRAGPDQVRG